MEKITNKTIKDLHAIITCHKDNNSEYTRMQETDKHVRIHTGESDVQYQSGILRIEIINNNETSEANIHVDAIMSFIFTAYGTNIKKRFLGIINYCKVRILSYFVKMK